ncbi:MAG TPA: hypothetical protein VJB63_02630 [Patescibacteria group bacterium]|nr:hypothetical protein [Patescibacteria group bacterium]
MLKKTALYFILILFLLIVSVSYARTAFAENEKNNIVGISVLQPTDEDLQETAELVNASGGEWGYVTVVIQENDRDTGKWQELFDKLRRLHLIPLVRLATRPEGAHWRRPEGDDAGIWVDFLDSLHWVVKERYVILFNEPNQGKEWGGRIDAEQYAEVAFNFASKLKEKNNDFFVMLAGMDAASPSNPPSFEDEEIFIRKVFHLSPFIFNSIDGWASHSYPRGFVGSPSDTGRHSIRTYQWELALLQKLGVEKKLPVFITETGWPHILNEKLKIKNNKVQAVYYSPEKVGEYIRIAYENVWLRDDRVRAVTPFVFNYPASPFDAFSWKYSSGKGLYPSYFAVQSMKKIKGNPEQIHLLSVEKNNLGTLPLELTTHSTYTFKISLSNKGQSIIDAKDGYAFFVTEDVASAVSTFFSDFSDFEPFDNQTANFFVKTSDTQGTYHIKVVLSKDKKIIQDLFTWDFAVKGPPPLQFGVQLFPHFTSNADTLEMQIFDQHEQLVFQKKQLKIKEGYGIINEVHNVALGERYRIVILNPYYIPRQKHIVFRSRGNVVVFDKMLPLDFNQDGKFSFVDWLVLVRNPSLLQLWWVQ